MSEDLNVQTTLRAGRLAKLYDDGGEALSVYWDEAREYARGHLVVQQYESGDQEIRLTREDAEWLVAHLAEALRLSAPSPTNRK